MYPQKNQQLLKTERKQMEKDSKGKNLFKGMEYMIDYEELSSSYALPLMRSYKLWAYSWLHHEVED